LEAVLIRNWRKGKPNMKRAKSSLDDEQRQLPLLAAPVVRIEVPQLDLDGPQPDCVWAPGAAGRLRATGDTVQAARDLVAMLRVRGQVVWTCNHAHGTRAGALACAYQARQPVRAGQD
jgi:hypothetical protein